MPSMRRRKTHAKVETLHAQVAQARLESLHQLSTRLVGEHGAIVIEDLHVSRGC
jgi:putative transposase